MNIRHAFLSDLDVLSEIENRCFPPSEAASKETLRGRLAVYPNHFWLMEENGCIVSFVNGMTTDESELRDEMYFTPELHNESGKWQMIFGVNTLPEYRRRGYAAVLLKRVLDDALEQGRQGAVLTCKRELLCYYGRLGFMNEGISCSEHGGAVWYGMRAIFKGAVLAQ